MVRSSVKFSPSSPVSSKIFIPGHRHKMPVRSNMRKVGRPGSRPDSGIVVEDLYKSASTPKSGRAVSVKKTRVHFDVPERGSSSQARHSVNPVAHFADPSSPPVSRKSISYRYSENATRRKPNSRRATSEKVYLGYYERTKTSQKPRPWHALLLEASARDSVPRLLKVTTNLHVTHHNPSPSLYPCDPYAEPFDYVDPSGRTFNLDDLARALPHPHRSQPSPSTGMYATPQRPSPQLHSELGMYPLQWSLQHPPHYATSSFSFPSSPDLDFGVGTGMMQMDSDLHELLDSPASPGTQTILINIRPRLGRKQPELGEVQVQVLDRLLRSTSSWGPIVVSKRQSPDRLYPMREITVLDVLEGIYWFFHERLTEEEERSLSVLEEEERKSSSGLMRIDLLALFGCTEFGGLSIGGCADMGTILELNLRLNPSSLSFGGGGRLNDNDMDMDLDD
ncbi:hypothetical protein D9758_016384 [Tetrapyrgos nigripes]|uniref:DUF6699 domain-containing protein n=1 Tax=Tetrapyrgos nigripes TaxID=182062 RepID=A0A8H5FHB5_9AGAR|nr:hypothetical protein D9758_016384 [Tetrapyrgos nigripes]